MKKALHILLLTLSALLILAVPVIPHHHHGGEECPVMEMCTADGACNDRHTSHHADGEAAGNTSCILSHVIATKICADAGQLQTSLDRQASPLAAIVGSDGTSYNEPLIASSDYGRYLVSPLPSCGRGFHTLRAPPYAN